MTRPAESANERKIRQAAQAVAAARRSAAADPGRGLPDLGYALLKLGSLLQPGLPDAHGEAATVLGEAVEVYRRLEATRPGDYPDGLAVALERRSLALGLTGHRAEALTLAREAVDLWRRLPAHEVRDELASALGNLGNQLAETGRHHEALDQFHEAVGIRRSLADRRTGAGRQDLASALGDLGIKLAEIGRQDEAVEVLCEAISIYRGNTSGPRAVGEMLGHASIAFALVRTLTGVGRSDDAAPYLAELQALRGTVSAIDPEAVAYLDQLLATFRRPPEGDAPTPDLIGRLTQLNEQGMSLAATGQVIQGADTLRRAAELARGLDSTATSAVLRARTLGNLSLVSAWAGRRDEALEAADQAVHICRRYLADAPDQLRFTLANALDSLGSRLALLGRHRDAVAPATETVALFRQLALTDAAHRGDLARGLNNLGIRLCDADRHTEAHSASREALDIRRLLYADDPDEHRPGLIHALSNLALRLARLDQHDEVARISSEAVQQLRFWDDIHPSSDMAELAESLGWLSWYLKRNGHRTVARDCAWAAKNVRQRTPKPRR